MRTLSLAVLMVALLAGVAGAQEPAPKPPEPSLLQQVAGSYTGRNGYEEFLQAADLLRESKLWKQAEGRLNDLTLTEKRLLLGEPDLRRALSLVTRGLRKPVFSPRMSLDFSTLLPELTHFRSLGRLLVVEQYILFADGRNQEALESLRTGLRFGQAIQQEALIGGLVGEAISAVVVQEAARHLDQLSARDCERLHAICLEWLASPAGLERVLERERAGIRLSMRKLVMDQQFQLRDLTGDINGVEQYERALNAVRQDPERARALLAEAEKTVDDAFRRMYDELRKPHWQRQDVSAPPGQSLVATWTSMLLPSLNSAFGAYARTEATLRLLATEALLRRYRWEHGKPPATLAVLDAEKLAIDPFSGQPLKYELRGGTYTLSSIGRETNADDPQAVDGRRPITLVH